MEAIFLLGVGYTKNRIAAITCLTIAVGFSGFAISGKTLPELYLLDLQTTSSYMFTLTSALILF